MASGLNLVVAAIVLWNTIYLEQAVAALESQGPPVPADCLPHLSPLGWEHINLTGDYIWDLRQTTTLQRLRALRRGALSVQNSRNGPSWPYRRTSPGAFCYCPTWWILPHRNGAEAHASGIPPPISDNTRNLVA